MTEPSQAPANDQRPTWLSPPLQVLLGLAFLGPFCFRRIFENDLGWHLALGRIIARDGIPFRNALCWPAVDHPWYSNSWLFDWLSFEVVSHFGMIAVQWLFLVLVALTLVAAAAAGMRLDRRYGAVAAPVLALLLIPRLTWRSFVASWVVLACVVWLCLPEAGSIPDHGRSTFKRRLWCIPIIALGSNLHQGAILAAMVLGIFCVESFLLGERRPREILLALGGTLALAANPGGLFGIVDSLSHVNIRSVVPIPEYAHPTLKQSALFFVFAAVAVVFAWTQRRRLPAMFTVVAIFAVLGVWAIRFVYDFEIIAVSLLGLMFGLLASRLGHRTSSLALVAVVIGVVAVRAPWAKALKPMSTDWDPSVMPVAAAEFVRSEHLDGHMFNNYTDGGYLEWALPDLLWFQDGRPHAFPEDFFQDGETNNPSPQVFRGWLDHWGVEWAIIRIHSPPQHVLHTPEWALVYWDNYSEVFIRRSVARFAPLIQRLEYHHFQDQAPLLKEIAAASRAELPQWRAEIARFETRCADCRAPAIVKCALDARSGEPLRDCDAATEEGAPRSLVAAMRAIPAAP